MLTEQRPPASLPRGRVPPRPGLRMALFRVGLLICLLCVLGRPSIAARLAAASDPAPLAHLLSGLVAPPLASALWFVALAGLAAIFAELIAALAILAGRRSAGQAALADTRYLRVLLPQSGAQAACEPAELHRALHAVLPGGRADPGLRCALVFGRSRSAPAELGIVVAGPRRARDQLAASLGAALRGLAPEVSVQAAPDPLLEAARGGRLLIWREFGLALPPAYPLRSALSGQPELLAGLAGALGSPSGALHVELQVVAQSLTGPLERALDHGWRGRATALRLRIAARAAYALAPDARLIEAKLADPAYAVTVRAVAIVSASDAPAAQVALDAIAAALGAAQTSVAGRLQGWRQIGHGSALASGAALMLRRVGRPTPPAGLLPWRAWCAPATLSAGELGGLWSLPQPLHARLVRWLSCRQLPAPPHAFSRRPGRLAIGYAAGADGRLAPVGPTLRDLRQILHLTAGMGAGKSRLLANLCRQFTPYGFLLIDGKGDDREGSLVATVQQLLDPGDEGRLILLDPLDAGWPIGLNPLGSAGDEPGGAGLLLGQVLALLARLDSETWGRAPGMQQYAQMATLLVLSGEPHPTLAHVRLALIDDAYRAHLLSGCRDRELQTFWGTIYPRSSEAQRSSRDALVRRLDLLLTSEVTRLMLTEARPLFDMRQAIVDRMIVLIPLPDVALGGLAGAVGMLILQSFVRAAFARPGSEQSRSSYPLVIDELQALVGSGSAHDLETAITRLRSLGIPAVYAHQALSQLGDLRELMMINAANRVILQTHDPDAALYARLYSAAGLTPADISGQPPDEHQYAVLRCDGRPAGPFSIRPLGWPLPAAEPAGVSASIDWQTIVPEASDPADALILQLVYGLPCEDRAIDVLAGLPRPEWERLLIRWDAIRLTQRSYILAHPGCIPQRSERQRWLTRLLVARPRVLALAEHARLAGQSHYNEHVR